MMLLSDGIPLQHVALGSLNKSHSRFFRFLKKSEPYDYTPVAYMAEYRRRRR